MSTESPNLLLLPAGNQVQFKIIRKSKFEVKEDPPESSSRHNASLDEIFLTQDNFAEWKDINKEIFEYVKQRTEEEIKVVNAFYKRNPCYLKDSTDPILHDILEEEFRYQIHKQLQLREIDQDDMNNLQKFYGKLKDLIRRYQLRLKDEEEIPFKDQIQSIINEDYKSFYSYKKNRNFLRFDQTFLLRPEVAVAEQQQVHKRHKKMTADELVEEQIGKYSIFNSHSFVEQFILENAKKGKVGLSGLSKLIGIIGSKAQEDEIKALQSRFIKYIIKIKKLKQKKDELEQRKLRRKQQMLAEIQEENPNQLKKVVKNNLSTQLELQHHRNKSVLQNGRTFRLKQARMSVDSPINVNPLCNESLFNKLRLSMVSSGGALLSPAFNNDGQPNKGESALQLNKSRQQSRQSHFPESMNKRSTLSQTPLEPRDVKNSTNLHLLTPVQPISLYKKSSHDFYSHTGLNSPCQSQKRVTFISATPNQQDLKDHIEKKVRKQQPTIPDRHKEEAKQKISDIYKSIREFQKEFKPSNAREDFNNQYALQMFQEDIRYENIMNSIKILDIIDHAKKAKFQKLLYFYHVNTMDDINSETKMIKNEVRTGMADPVRTAAIIELQNFIKKNVGKKQIMSKIAAQSSKNMLVKSSNMSFDNHHGLSVRNPPKAMTQYATTKRKTPYN